MGMYCLCVDFWVWVVDLVTLLTWCFDACCFGFAVVVMFDFWGFFELLFLWFCFVWVLDFGLVCGCWLFCGVGLVLRVLELCFVSG